MSVNVDGIAGERSWPAPAKLNLFLHIVGRRPDGYHELQTCFQFIDARWGRLSMWSNAFRWAPAWVGVVPTRRPAWWH